MFLQLISLAAAMSLAEPPKLVPEVECRVEPVTVAVVEPTPRQGGVSGALVHYLMPTYLHSVREGWHVDLTMTWPIRHKTATK